MFQISEIKFRSLASDIPLENTEQFSDMARTFAMFNYYFEPPKHLSKKGRDVASVVHNFILIGHTP